MRVCLIHGAYTRKDQSRLFLLQKPLEEAGISVERFNYGPVTALTSMLPSWVPFIPTNAKAAQAAPIDDADVVVGYSNGAPVAERAIRLLPIEPVSRKHLICLSPALHSDHEFSKLWDSVTVFWNQGDNMSIAEHWGWHEWGAMMREGIFGRPLERNEQNINIAEFVNGYADYEHGDYFEYGVFQRRFLSFVASLRIGPRDLEL